jgi:hypothetical protein
MIGWFALANSTVFVESSDMSARSDYYLGSYTFPALVKLTNSLTHYGEDAMTSGV